MFRSLYTRFQDELQPKQEGSQAVLDWPATYADGLVMLKPEAWHLEVGGHLEKSRQYTLAELRNLPQVTQNRRIVSAEAWTYRTEWAGIPFHHLVEQVRPASHATVLKQTDLSGHVEYLPLQDALKSRAMLCYGVSGKPLSPLYGGPVRLLVFDRYCYKGLTQLARLDFIAPEEEGKGFWQERGYSADGSIEPGKYYAFDLKRARPIPQPGEVTIY